MRSNGVVGTVLTLAAGGDDSLWDDRHVFFVLERPRLSFMGFGGGNGGWREWELELESFALR